MTSIFTIVPRILMWPSYRSFVGVLVFLVGPAISMVFISIAKVIMYFRSMFADQASRISRGNARQVNEYIKTSIKKKQ